MNEEQLTFLKGFKSSESPEKRAESLVLAPKSPTPSPGYPIDIKPTVTFVTLKPEIYSIFSIVSDIFHSVGKTTVITSANDGVHKGYELYITKKIEPGKISKHYFDLAIDLRSKHLLDSKQKHMVFDLLKVRLGLEYLVLFENEGKDNEHFHIQYVGILSIT